MKGAGHQLLARAGFAGDQHRRGDRRHALKLIEGFAQCRRMADDLVVMMGEGGRVVMRGVRRIVRRVERTGLHFIVLVLFFLVIPNPGSGAPIATIGSTDRSFASAWTHSRRTASGHYCPAQQLSSSYKYVLA